MNATEMQDQAGGSDGAEVEEAGWATVFVSVWTMTPQYMLGQPLSSADRAFLRGSACCRCRGSNKRAPPCKMVPCLALHAGLLLLFLPPLLCYGTSRWVPARSCARRARALPARAPLCTPSDSPHQRQRQPGGPPAASRCRRRLHKKLPPAPPGLSLLGRVPYRACALWDLWLESCIWRPVASMMLLLLAVGRSLGS